MIKRRDFIKYASFTTVGIASLPKLALSSINKSQPLPLPEIIEPNSNAPVNLIIQDGVSEFITGKKTHTSGINTSFLGPTVKVRRGQNVTFEVENQLDEPITLHWHGLEIPGHLDGGPHQIIKSGEKWNPTLTIDQPASTCWFHPHLYPQTADLVMRGIAGLLIIEDDETDKLNLPSSWGEDDFPIIIQDRTFKPDGNFDYELLDIVNVATGFAGKQVLINGALNPTVSCHKGFVRLRFLNGSNARSYTITTSDQRDMHIIASDGGLLSNPVPVKEFDIIAGERYEVIIDTSDGKAFDVFTLPFEQMGMKSKPFHQPLPIFSVSPISKQSFGKLPNELATLPTVDTTKAHKTRSITLEMNSGIDKQAMAIMMSRKKGMPIPSNIKMLSQKELMTVNSINGQPFNMSRIDLDVTLGHFELWTIDQGDDAMLHPFHIHGCRFRVISINKEAPPVYMQGWKDTVIVPPKGEIEILVQFNHLADKDRPYMAHCHILEHEDTGMMMQFTVSNP